MAAGRFRIPSLTVLAGGSPNGRRKDNRPNGRVLPGMARRIRKCTCRTGAVACSSSGTIAFSAAATYGRKDAPKPAAKRATERRAASCRVHAAYANPAWYPRRHGIPAGMVPHSGMVSTLTCQLNCWRGKGRVRPIRWAASWIRRTQSTGSAGLFEPRGSVECACSLCVVCRRVIQFAGRSSTDPAVAQAAPHLLAACNIQHGGRQRATVRACNIAT